MAIAAAAAIATGRSLIVASAPAGGSGGGLDHSGRVGRGGTEAEAGGGVEGSLGGATNGTGSAALDAASAGASNAARGGPRRRRARARRARRAGRGSDSARRPRRRSSADVSGPSDTDGGSSTGGLVRSSPGAVSIAGTSSVVQALADGGRLRDLGGLDLLRGGRLGRRRGVDARLGGGAPPGGGRRRSSGRRGVADDRRARRAASEVGGAPRGRRRLRLGRRGATAAARTAAWPTGRSRCGSPTCPSPWWAARPRRSSPRATPSPAARARPPTAGRCRSRPRNSRARSGRTDGVPRPGRSAPRRRCRARLRISDAVWATWMVAVPTDASASGTKRAVSFSTSTSTHSGCPVSRSR